MTFEEQVFYALMQNIYTFSICKIVSIDTANSTATVKPVTGGSNITDVPIFALGSSSGGFLKIKMSSGDIVPVLHCKDDISNFLANENQGVSNNLSKFAKTNAVILPFKVNFLEGGFALPEVDFEFDGEVKFNGEVKFGDEVTFEGDVISQGDITSSGTVTGETQVSAGPIVTRVNLTTHQHPTAATGPPSAPIPGT